jgi:CRP/FNR family cyclic AMP-dependent transcriptional regulator
MATGSTPHRPTAVAPAPALTRLERTPDLAHAGGNNVTSRTRPSPSNTHARLARQQRACFTVRMHWELLAPLSETERDQVLRSARRRTFRAHDIVVHEGDPADAMHLVISGRLAVCVTTPSGQNATLSILSPGDYFGEIALLRSNQPRVRSATVACLQDCETLSLTYATFDQIRAAYPGVGHLLESAMATRVEQLSARLVEAMYVGLDRRVYRCLVHMLDVFAGSGAPGEIPLTQDQLSDLVGGTRPSVNQVLQRLAAQQIIRLARGRVFVLDVARLRAKGHDGSS